MPSINVQEPDEQDDSGAISFIGGVFFAIVVGLIVWGVVAFVGYQNAQKEIEQYQTDRIERYVKELQREVDDIQRDLLREKYVQHLNAEEKVSE